MLTVRCSLTSESQIRWYYKYCIFPPANRSMRYLPDTFFTISQYVFEKFCPFCQTLLLRNSTTMKQESCFISQSQYLVQSNECVKKIQDNGVACFMYMIRTDRLEIRTRYFICGQKVFFFVYKKSGKESRAVEQINELGQQKALRGGIF